MPTPDRTELNRALIGAAREIVAKIARQLDADMAAQTITLTREEAVLAQGLLAGAAETLEREGEE